MALDEYNPKILNFLYELTKLSQPLSYKEIADSIKLESGKVSPKTVERWFNFLKKPYDHPQSMTKDRFDYFPKFFYEKLGLVCVFVIFEGGDEKILQHKTLQNYQNYKVWLYNTESKEKNFLVTYLIPIKEMASFKKELAKIKVKQIKDYQTYEAHSSFMIYSPWHKVIDESGKFHPEKNVSSEIDSQIENLKSYLDNLPDFNMIREIKENPLMIPVLFEYWRQYRSSHEVWVQIKNNFGDSVWKYIRKKKKNSEGVGIKKVQLCLENIKEHKISEGMRLAYMPLQPDNIFIYFISEFENEEDSLKGIRGISLNSIQLSIYPISSKKFFIISLTGLKGFKKLLEIFEEVKIEDIYFLQHEKSVPLLTSKKYKRFNYAKNFEPRLGEWKKIN